MIIIEWCPSGWVGGTDRSVGIRQ